jgi:tetratricopeptide (TPR) repeat protein
MGKLKVLFLSVCISVGGGKVLSQPFPAPDCAQYTVRDSLVKRYITDGAVKAGVSYTDARWPLYCDSILSICAEVAEAYQLKALPYTKYGNYLIAMPLIDKAVLYDTLQFLPYRAFIKGIFAKDYDGAIADFSLCQRLSGSGGVMDHSFSFYLGLCYMENGDDAMASRYLSEDIAMQQGRGPEAQAHFNAWLYSGIVQMNLGHLDTARSQLQKCLDQYPQHPEGNYYMAAVLFRMGLLVEGKKYASAGRAGHAAGYRMNEDNLYYVNYPKQVSSSDFDALLPGECN